MSHRQFRTDGVTLHCPSRIKVHDAIDLIVAQIVDYYGSSRSLRVNSPTIGGAWCCATRWGWYWL